MRHILIIGNPSDFANELNPKEEIYSCICHEQTLKKLTPLLKSQLAHIRELSFEIEDLDMTLYERNYQNIQAAANEIWQKNRFERIVGNDEHLILVAAKLRQHFALNGTSPDQAIKFRDKIIMKRTVAESGLPHPRFCKANSESKSEATRLLEECGMVVCKPISQAASRGILVSDKAEEICSYIEQANEAVDVEEFIKWDVHQIDCVVIEGSLRFICCFRSVYPPASWGKTKNPIICIITNDGTTIDAAISFAQNIIGAFGVTNAVLHIEAFWNPVRKEFVFLEIAARPGGAGTISTLRKKFNFDLAKINAQIELGRQVELPSNGLLSLQDDIAAFLFLPLPTTERGVITGYHIETGDAIVLESSLLGIGEEINATPSAYQSPATFILKGTCAQELLYQANSINDNSYVTARVKK